MGGGRTIERSVRGDRGRGRAGDKFTLSGGGDRREGEGLSK